LQSKKDKLAHFIVCIGLSVGLFYIFRDFLNLPWGSCKLYTVLGVMILGFLKEVFDLLIRRIGFDWVDLGVDLLGALTGIFVYKMI